MNDLDWMYNLQRFGMKPGLEVTRKLLHHLDNPHEKLKIIHVVGTNGKGSTCAFLESILRIAGNNVVLRFFFPRFLD